METSINLAIKNLKDSLIKAINDSELPIGVIELILYELYNQSVKLNMEEIIKESN